jgi:hypothetical protein
MEKTYLRQFLTQFVGSAEVKKAEPLLTKLASRFLDLLNSREKIETLGAKPMKLSFFIARDEKAVKKEMLEAMKGRDWATVSILAAELDLKSSHLKHEAAVKRTSPDLSA